MILAGLMPRDLKGYIKVARITPEFKLAINENFIKIHRYHYDKWKIFQMSKPFREINGSSKSIENSLVCFQA